MTRRSRVPARPLLAAFLSLAFTVAAGPQQMDRADATRLLEQTTFGPTDALIAHVQAVGMQGWLAEQFAAPASRYPAFAYVPQNAQAYCATSPDPQCLRDNYSLFLLQNAFFRNALAGPDQLRQRVAFALSQIFVTSGVVIHAPYGMAAYQQILLDGAFGNFEDLLTRVTLSPVMGDYLDMADNDKPAAGVSPNENYATRGDAALLDRRLGAQRRRHADARRVGRADSRRTTRTRSRASRTSSPAGPIRRCRASRCASTTRRITWATCTPSRRTTISRTRCCSTASLDAGGKPMSADLAFGLHNVFAHHNVGPFIGRQLIQKLVTGDPSPQYVARVAAAFDEQRRGRARRHEGGGHGDPHRSRGARVRQGRRGLRQAARAGALCRGGGARARQPYPTASTSRSRRGIQGEDLFYAPSVFNYYPPGYVVPGTSLGGTRVRAAQRGDGDRSLQLRQRALVRRHPRAAHAGRAPSAPRPTGPRCRRSPRIRVRWLTSSTPCCCTAP